MKLFSRLRGGGGQDWVYGPGAEPTPEPPGRQRLVVFSVVLVAALLVGLGYTFLRPALYRAMALVQITLPAGLSAPPAPAGGVPVAGGDAASSRPSLAGEIQVLTSRPLLDQAWERLVRAGELPGELGEAPAEDLQRRLGASVLEGSQVVQLWAVGRDPARLALLVNTLIQVYTEHLGAAYHSDSADSMAQARDEAARLARDVKAKRAEVDAFQQKHNIVSPERDEQVLLSRAKSMSAALGKANERVVEAEAQLRSLQESKAAGRAVARAKDNPTLASMEQRASELREELRDLERNFAPAYLAMDPQVRAKRTRLAELEDQMATERQRSQSAAIAEAQEEVASARGAALQLQQQMAGDRREVQDFSLRFNEYKALQEQLEQLENLRRGAEERAMRLEASEGGRRPAVAVIEWAAPPTEVWSPRYGRDAAISVGAALVLALFAVWLVEFVRPRPETPPLAMQPAWIPIPVPATAPPPLVKVPAVERLAAVPVLPRELNRSEVASLLETAAGAARLAIAGLLSGLNPEELLALGRENVDRDAKVLRVGGVAPRQLPLAGAWLAALEESDLGSEADAAGPLVTGAQGRPMTASELEALLLSAAHDAGLADPAEVSAAALRHTYIAYLVRQGVRFADLPAAVGPLPAASLAAYSALAPEGARLAAEQISWVYPCQAA